MQVYQAIGPGLISRCEMTGYSELGVVRNVASADVRGQAFVARPCSDLLRWGLQRVTKVRLNFAASFEACLSEDAAPSAPACGHSATIHSSLFTTHLFRL